MPSDDELRRVAEDVRALARSLARDMRELVNGARREGRPAADDVRAAGWAARDDLRRARQAMRDSRRAGQYRYQGHWSQPPSWGPPPRQYHWGPPTPPPPSTPPPAAPDHGQGAAPPEGPGTQPTQGQWTAEGQSPWPGSGPYGGGTGRGGPPWVAPAWPPRRPRPPQPPLRHRRDGSTLLGFLVVVFGLTWLAAGAHLIRIPLEGVVAVSLMVLGATMVVTARTDWALSRRRWPVFVGLGLVVALLLSSASPGLASGLRHLSFGRNSVTPITWAEVPAVVHANVGHTVVDLTQVTDPLPADRSLRVEGGAGTLEVHLPRAVHEIVDVRLGAGTILIDGVPPVGGWRQSVHGELNPYQPGYVLTVSVTSGVGKVVVDNQTPAVPAPPGTGPFPSAGPATTATPSVPATSDGSP